MPGSNRRHSRNESAAPCAVARARPDQSWLRVAFFLASLGLGILLIAALSRFAGAAEADSLGTAVETAPAAPSSAVETPPADVTETPPAAATASPTTAETQTPRSRPDASSARLPEVPARPPTPVAAPADLRDLNEWLEYKAQSQRLELAQEARLFYRRGLQAQLARSPEEATRLVRGAAELDPSFAEPRWTLAWWELFRDPGLTLAQLSLLQDQMRVSFALQLGLVSNAIYVLLFALYFALIALGLLIVVAHQGELRHPIMERLSHWVSRPTAALWSWVLMALPWALGLGVVLPTVVLLGFLWPHLRRTERAVWIMLVAFLAAAPFIGREVGRLALPMSEDHAPFYGVLGARNDSDPARGQERFSQLARSHPQNPFVQFGLAWTARNVGQPEVAEEAYRRTLRLWPGSERVMNNLGNVLMIQGRTDEAIALYRKAVIAAPENAAPHFNLSQAYIKSFDFRHAAEEMSTASRLDFELVRTHKGRPTADGFLPLADQWLPPQVFWDALLAAAPATGARAALPPALQKHPLAAGPSYAFLIVILAGIGMSLGILRNRKMTLRHCANCARVLCRRCSAHRRAVPLCHGCARAESAAKSGEFSKVLLRQQRRRVLRVPGLLLTAIATLVPGLGLVVSRSVVSAFTILLGIGALISCAGRAAPYAFEPRLTMADRDVSLVLALLPWAALYAWSIWGYFQKRHKLEERLEVAIQSLRPRPTTPPRHVGNLAA